MAKEQLECLFYPFWKIGQTFLQICDLTLFGKLPFVTGSIGVWSSWVSLLGLVLSPAQCPVSCSLNAPSSARMPPLRSYWPADRPIIGLDGSSKEPPGDQRGDRGAVAAVSKLLAAIYMYICPPPCHWVVTGGCLPDVDTTFALLHVFNGQQKPNAKNCYFQTKYIFSNRIK